MNEQKQGRRRKKEHKLKEATKPQHLSEGSRLLSLLLCFWHIGPNHPLLPLTECGRGKIYIRSWLLISELLYVPEIGIPLEIAKYRETVFDFWCFLAKVSLQSRLIKSLLSDQNLPLFIIVRPFYSQRADKVPVLIWKQPPYTPPHTLCSPLRLYLANSLIKGRSEN